MSFACLRIWIGNEVSRINSLLSHICTSGWRMPSLIHRDWRTPLLLIGDTILICLAGWRYISTVIVGKIHAVILRERQHHP
jgi:hypothetical protein